jgi:hypothetical protein
MNAEDEKAFHVPAPPISGFPPETGLSCKGSWSDQKFNGSAHWGDNLLFAGSGGSFTMTVVNPVNNSATPSPGGGSFWTSTPGYVTYGAIGAGTVAFLAKNGGSSNNTPGGTTPAAPDFQSTVVGSHALVYQVSTSSGTLCGAGQSSSGSVTMSGTASATTAVFTNLPDTGSTPVTVTGTTTQNSDGTFTFKGTVTGGTPTGGTFSFTITITFTPVTGAASKAAGSASGVAGCSSLTVTITIGSA